LSEQLDRTRLKSDNVKNTVRSELAVTDDENAYPEANSYGYENDTEGGYGFFEDCEEGFEFCKKKMVQVRIHLCKEYKKKKTLAKLRTTPLLLQKRLSDYLYGFMVNNVLFSISNGRDPYWKRTRSPKSR